MHWNPLWGNELALKFNWLYWSHCIFPKLKAHAIFCILILQYNTLVFLSGLFHYNRSHRQERLFAHALNACYITDARKWTNYGSISAGHVINCLYSVSPQRSKHCHYGHYSCLVTVYDAKQYVKTPTVTIYNIWMMTLTLSPRVLCV